MELASTALNVNLGDPVFIGDFFGFLLALPISLFLAYWLSTVAVKNHIAVIIGAFIGALIGFFIIWSWAGTLLFDPAPISTNGAAVFFGSVLFCSVMGLAGGITTDLLVARGSRKAYRRQITQEH
ncbi:MAG TPA: PTS sucrose transporter subunit IIBC [Ktedonobacteraceae bacterium]|nr:PTS sucrose transporter subunit IIBC [Ktedonobacteraceae bacterium]